MSWVVTLTTGASPSTLTCSVNRPSRRLTSIRASSPTTRRIPLRIPSAKPSLVTRSSYTPTGKRKQLISTVLVTQRRARDPRVGIDRGHRGSRNSRARLIRNASGKARRHLGERQGDKNAKEEQPTDPAVLPTNLRRTLNGRITSVDKAHGRVSSAAFRFPYSWSRARKTKCI